MSSARGAAGANKPKLHNVNNVYSGKNNAANRATGPNRYGGLQSIGKASVVRRMPPPASLPSLKSEYHGSHINIVPVGSTGWNKANTASDPAISTKAAAVEANGSTTTAAKVVSTGSTSTADMRPDWAKSSSQAENASNAESQALSAPNKTQSTDSAHNSPASGALADDSSDESTAPITLNVGSGGAGYIGVNTRTAPRVPIPTRMSGGYDAQASEKYKIAKRGMFKEESNAQELAQDTEDAAVAAQEKENEDVSELQEKPAENSSGPAAAATSVNVVAPMPPQQAQTAPNVAPQQSANPAVAEHAPSAPEAWTTGSPVPQQQQQHQASQQYVPAPYPPMQQQPGIGKGYGDEQHRSHPLQQQQQQPMYYQQQHGGGDSYRHSHLAEQAPPPPQQQQQGNRMFDSRGSEFSNDYRKSQPQQQQQQPPQDWHRPPPPERYNSFEGSRNPNEPDGMGWYDHPQQPIYRNNYGSGWQQPMVPQPRYPQAPPQASQQNGTAAWYTTAVPGPPQLIPVDQQQQMMKGPPMRNAYPPQQLQQGQQQQQQPPQQHQHQQQQQQQQQQNAPQHAMQRRSSQSSLDQPQQEYVADEPSRSLQQGQEREAAIERSRQKRRVGNNTQQNDYRQSSFEIDSSYGGHWSAPSKDNRQDRSDRSDRQDRHQDQRSSKPPRGSTRRSDGSDYVAEGFKVLQRPPTQENIDESPAHSGVPVIDDDDENEIQLKKLPKTGKITKRESRQNKQSGDKQNAGPKETSTDLSKDSANRSESPTKPAPVPVDNIWERRLEERESAEREKQQLKLQQQQSKGNRRGDSDKRGESAYFDDDSHRSSKRGDHKTNSSRRGASTGAGLSRGGARGGSLTQKVRTERAERPERPERPERTERSERPERPERESQPDFGDNFSNMGEFHVEDTVHDTSAKPKRPERKPRGMSNGIIHRGSGRKVLLPDPVDVKRSNPEERQERDQAVPRDRERPVRGVAHRRGIATRGKIRGGISSVGVRKPSRNVTSKHSQLTVETEQQQQQDADQTVPHLPAASSDRGSMLKSPVNSSEGVGEEWETASESSGVISKYSSKEKEPERAAAATSKASQHVTKSASTSSVPNSRKTSSTAKTNAQQQGTNNQQRSAGQKNAKPASHTSHVRDASNSKSFGANKISSTKSKSERAGRSASASNARDSGSKSSASTGLNNKDGLAGVDINNASVVVIDDHPATLDVASTTDEGFVEVLSKSARRQRQLEEQQKAEAEKKRALKEKERLEKLQAKKASKATAKTLKSNNKKEKSKGSDTETEASKKAKEDLLKNVWNSDVLPANLDESLRGVPVIPSPIARPTPKPAAKITEQEATMTIVTKTPEPLIPKEDSAFSPPTNKLKKQRNSAAAAASVVVVERAAAVVDIDDEGTKSLQQNLDKVKEFWPGQREFPNSLLEKSDPSASPVPPAVSSAAHGPNVAKVRPQPQSTTDVVSPPVVQKEPVVPQHSNHVMQQQQQHSQHNNAQRPMMHSPAQLVATTQSNIGIFAAQNAHYQPLIQNPSPFGGMTMPGYSVMFNNGDLMHPASNNSPPAQNIFAPIAFNGHPPPNQRPVAPPVPPPSRGSANSSSFEMGPFFPGPPNLPSWSTNELTTPPPVAPQRFFNTASAAYSVPPPNKTVPPPLAQGPQRAHFNQPPPPIPHPQFGVQPTPLDFGNKAVQQRIQHPPIHQVQGFGNNFGAHPPPAPLARYAGPPPPSIFGNDTVWSANPKDQLPTQHQNYGLFQKPPPNMPGYGAAVQQMMPGRNDRWSYPSRGIHSQQPHQFAHNTKENVFIGEHHQHHQNGRTSVASTSSGPHKPTSKA